MNEPLSAYSWMDRDIEGKEEQEVLGFCLDRNSDPVLVRAYGYPHSFYIELPSVVQGTRIRWDDGMVTKLMVNVEKVLWRNKPISFQFCIQKKYNFYRGDIHFPFILFKFANGFHARYAKYELEKPLKTSLFSVPLMFKVHEHGVSFITKFLTNRKQDYCQWFRLGECELVSRASQISTCEREYRVRFDQISAIPHSESQSWTTHPGVLAFDIETYSQNHKKFPNMFLVTDVPYIISAIYQRFGQPETRKRFSVVLGDTDDVPLSHAEIRRVKNEHELTAYFCEVIKKTDPEIITSYNGNSFDWIYLDSRMKGILKWPNVSRLKNREMKFYSREWESSGAGKNRVAYLPIPGRMNIDLLPYVRQTTKLDKYTLDTVAKHFLKNKDMEKHGVTVKQMFETFAEMQECIKNKRDTSDVKKKMAEILAYCIQDSELVIELFEKFNMWTSLIQMSNILAVSPEDLYTRGQQIRCFNQVYRLAKEEKYVLDTRSGETVDSFAGGFVQEPIPGIHDLIICYDFASLYPSIMQAYNISHDTYIPPEVQIDESMCHIIEFDDDGKDEDAEEGSESGDEIDGEDEKKEKKAKVTRHFKFRFIKQQYKEGILASLVKKLVERRREVKKLMKPMDKAMENEELYDKVLYGILDSQQLALKISANSMFGFLGAINGMLPLPEGAASITAVGRQSIALVNDYFVKLGGRIVYNDTDSCMVDLGLTNIKEVEEKGEFYSKEITKLFPSPMKLEFEKGMRMFCLKKKMYAAFLIKKGVLVTDPDKMLVRGIVLARRDNCVLLRELYRGVLLNVMNLGSADTSMKLIYEAVAKLISGQVTAESLRIIRSLGNNYKNKKYFMKLYADYLARIGKPAQPGDRLEYIVVKAPGEKYIGNRMRPLEDFVIGGSEEQIDYGYYLEHIFANRVDQIFSIGHAKEMERFEGIGYRPTPRHKLTPLSTPVMMLSKLIGRDESIEFFPEWWEELKAKPEEPKTVQLELVVEEEESIAAQIERNADEKEMKFLEKIIF